MEKIFRKHQGITVIAGWNSPYGAGNVRWDGQMLDAIYKEAGISTVSFVDPTTAHAVLSANGKVRRNKRRAKVGDAVFLAREGYVGVVRGSGPTNDYISVLIGWLDGEQGKRYSDTRLLHVDIDILAVADPDLRVRYRSDPPTVSTSDKQRIANLLHSHPAIGVYVPPENFTAAYARWQRYCGYQPNKVTGRVDADSLERLAREVS